MLGEIRALRAAFGDDVEIRIAEQHPEAAQRIYPEFEFFGALHTRNLMRPVWPPFMNSFHWRRTRLAVRLLRSAPWLGRALLSSRQRAHLQRMAETDIVVATGGTYFVEHYNFSAKADEVLAAHALGKPVYLFTQSMGPFRRAENRGLMKRVVEASEGVFLRDERSRRNLLEVGVDERKLGVHADAAFALAPSRPSGSEGAVATVTVGAAATVTSGGATTVRPCTARIAVSVRAWKFAATMRAAGTPESADDQADERYRRAVADAVRALARSGAEVVFVSTCQGLPEFSDDSRLAQRIVDEHLAGEPNVRVDRSFRTPTQLIDQLAGFDVAIATRMHFAILALAAGTPVVAIAYEFKSRELLRGMGWEDRVTDYNDVSADWLVARATQVLEAGAALRADVARMVEVFRADAVRPAERIATEWRRRA